MRKAIISTVASLICNTLLGGMLFGLLLLTGIKSFSVAFTIIWVALSLNTFFIFKGVDKWLFSSK